MFEKTPYFSDGKGKLTPRFKGQDEIPKVFKHRPEFMIWMFETPTERRLLWMIYHYPYIFNVFFLSDVNRNFNKGGSTSTETPIAKALKVCHTLKMKGFIKESKDHHKLYLTLTGHIHRVTSHSAFPLVAIILTITTITVGVLNYNKPSTTIIQPVIVQPESQKEKNIPKTENSEQYNPVQTDSVKDKDSSLTDNGKTKTFGR